MVRGELSGVHLRTNTKQTIEATLPVKMRLFFGPPFFLLKRKVAKCLTTLFFALTKESNIKSRCVTFDKKPVLSFAKQKGDDLACQISPQKVKKN